MTDSKTDLVERASRQLYKLGLELTGFEDGDCLACSFEPMLVCDDTQCWCKEIKEKYARAVIAAVLDDLAQDAKAMALDRTLDLLDIKRKELGL